MSSHDMRIQFERLIAERHAPNRSEHSADGVYMTELDDELSAAREGDVGLAVTEIASRAAAITAVCSSGSVSHEACRRRPPAAPVNTLIGPWS